MPPTKEERAAVSTPLAVLMNGLATFCVMVWLRWDCGREVRLGFLAFNEKRDPTLAANDTTLVALVVLLRLSVTALLETCAEAQEGHGGAARQEGCS
jgi:hypothetical protein